MEGNRAGSAPANPLRAFLRDRRKAIQPEDVGIPRGRSRSVGLRREDVAELLQVSPLWYSLFESGTSGRRFSATFLEGVQRTLQLGRDDRRVFMTLVISGGHATPEVEAKWHTARWELLVDDVAGALQQVEAAGSLDQAVQLAHASLGRLLENLQTIRVSSFAGALHGPTVGSTVA
jgi:hypothetical protein